MFSGGSDGSSTTKVVTIDRYGVWETANFYADGNLKVRGAVSGGGADYAEYFEWQDGNSNADNRIGMSVILNSNCKIQIATSNDLDNDILGVVSASPSMVGNDAWSTWQGAQLRDDFGQILYEDISFVEWTNSDGSIQGYYTDRIPENVVIPENAISTTRKRDCINPLYDSNIPYIPRNERPEWSMVGMLGIIRVRSNQVMRNSWRKIRTLPSGVEEWLLR